MNELGFYGHRINESDDPEAGEAEFLRKRFLFARCWWIAGIASTYAENRRKGFHIGDILTTLARGLPISAAQKEFLLHGR